MVTITVPERFERDSLAPFFEKLDVYRNVDNVCLDVGNLKFSYPTAMLVAGAKLREWVMYRRQNGLRSRRSGVDPSRRVISYLMHLGFFDFIGMGVGKSVGEAGGSSSYLPITRVTRPEFNPFDQTVMDWYESIQHEANRLAKVLSQNDADALSTYVYAIREIIRNVFEHSKTEECFICGQRWWGGKVEISIIDEGVGISSTLRESYEIQTDDQALQLAIRPGVSRTNAHAAQNVFDNSGFGLFVLSEVGNRFGWFAIGSGSKRLIGTGGRNVIEDFSFPGTFIGIQLFKPVVNFGLVLDEIIEQGESLSDQTGISKKASGASKLINL